MDFPRNILALAQQTLALMGRVGATRVYTTPPVTALPGPGTISQPAAVRFTTPGWVLAMYGQESQQATPASYARTGVRVQIGGDQDLFIDGNGGPSYGSMLALFGGVNNWFPLVRRVVQGDLWITTFRNNDPALAITPEVEFAFFADADLAQMAAGASAVGQFGS